MSTTGKYQEQLGAPHPGLFIFLLDQSGSMDEKFGSGLAGQNRRKADVVETILNAFINDIIKSCTKGMTNGIPVISPRAFVAAIGYGGNDVSSALGGALKGRDIVSLEDLFLNPLEVQRRDGEDIDDMGKTIKVKLDFPIWIKAVSDGGTPMVSALRRAKDIAEAWIARETKGRSHRKNYPPVVINITDGYATDDTVSEDCGATFPAVKAAAAALTGLSTDDGNVLLYNCHLSAKGLLEVQFPGDEAKVPKGDDYCVAETFYSISSELPDTTVKQLHDALNLTVEKSARGFVYNGQAVALSTLVKVGTVNAGVINANT